MVAKWCVVIPGGVWWFMVVCGGCIVVCGGSWWCVVVHGGVWWLMVVCGGCIGVHCGGCMVKVDGGGSRRWVLDK